MADNMADPMGGYYTAGGIETIDVIRAKLTKEQFAGYLLGNIIKYATRINFKGEASRDARKLLAYAQYLADSGEMR